VFSMRSIYPSIGRGWCDSGLKSR